MYIYTYENRYTKINCNGEDVSDTLNLEFLMNYNTFIERIFLAINKIRNEFI